MQTTKCLVTFFYKTGLQLIKLLHFRSNLNLIFLNLESIYRVATRSGKTKKN